MCELKSARTVYNTLASSNTHYDSSNVGEQVSTQDLKQCVPIDGLSLANKSSDTTGLMTFANEACESVDVHGQHSHPPRYGAIPEVLSDLKEYFRRPILKFTGTLPTARGGITTFPWSVASTIGAFPFGTTRLLGSWGARYTTVLTITVAATPFHQGVLAAGFSYATLSTDPRYSSANTITNLPHVRMDISETTMVQLRVPFLAAFEYLELSNTLNVGFFSIQQLLGVPLPSGITAPTIRVFMHLEDLELVSAVPLATNSVVVNSGRLVSAQASEISEASHPYSSIVSSASRTLTLAGRAFPLIKGLMSTPTWFLDSAAATIRSFGYSRPTNKDPASRMLPMQTALEHNVDVPSAAIVLGPLSSNTLATDGELGATDVDEMSLAFVTSQWSQVASGTLTTLQTYTTAIVKYPCSPYVMWYRNRIGQADCGGLAPPLFKATLTNSFQPSSLMAISSCFRLWKGSLQFRLTFAKTKFHSGRLLLAFCPTVINVLPPTGTINVSVPSDGSNLSPTGYSATFDLKDSNVVEFTCPYVSLKPFLAFDESFGSFTVTVLDPLVGPATVQQSVDYMVEVRGAPDFELAVPVTNRWPVINNNPTVFAQSGRTVSAGPAVLTSTALPSDSKYTVGERILSVKQLIQVPKCSSCGATAAGAVNGCAIPPWWWLPQPAGVLPAPTAFIREQFSLPGFLAQLYAFATGSTEANVYNYGPGTALISAVICAQEGNDNNSSTTYLQSPALSNPTIISTSTLHFKTPAYQNFKRYFTATLSNISWSLRFGSTTSPPITTSPFHPTTVGVVAVSNPAGGAAVQTVISRQAGDDGRLATYLGPLPFAFLSTNVTGFWDPEASLGFA